MVTDMEITDLLQLIKRKLNTTPVIDLVIFIASFKFIEDAV